MEEMTVEHEMGLRSYGFGRWDAPLWFIGPEQGKGKDEPEDNDRRVEAWKRLGKTELCDCLEFHAQISDLSWHVEGANLQSTWRPLILLLKTFLDQPAGIDNIRTYQRDRWGRVNSGETCVIELSGSAARSSRTPGDRTRFLQKRIEHIRQRMLSFKPVFVVMYGAKEQRYWEEIASCPLIRDGVVKVGSTMIAFTPHPQDRGRRNDDWTKLGKTLRRQSG